MAPVKVAPISQSPPLNSVHLILDGTGKQVLPCYIYCQEYFCNWNIELSTHQVEILRDNSNVLKVFTTPTRSTFYYAMTYQGRHLVFVIEGRKGWLHGYYGKNRIYEFDSVTQVEPYIKDPRCKRLPFDGNHCEISRGSTGKIRIGLHAIRDAFDAIWEYNGSKEYPKGFNTAFGIIVVHICESMKLRPVFRRICEAFTDPSVRKLGIDGSDFIERLITSWSYMSGQAMRAIDITDYEISNTRKVPHISSEQDILTHLAVLHVDAYFGGIFKHDADTNLPHWEPLERGNGVPSFDDIRYLEKRTDDDNGGSDGDQQDGQSGGKQKSEGDGKGRHHGKSKGKGGEGGGRWGGRDGGGGLGRRRGVSLLASSFSLVGRWSVGQGKNLSMEQNLNELVMQPQDLVCIYVLMCKPPGMSIMEENKYPWCQLIKNRSLTSLSFYTTNLQQQYSGALAMTLSGDRLSTTEPLKWIVTALLGLEDWYLIGWG